MLVIVMKILKFHKYLSMSASEKSLISFLAQSGFFSPVDFFAKLIVKHIKTMKNSVLAIVREISNFHLKP